MSLDVSYSQLESGRFGYHIHRGNASSLDYSAVLDYIKRHLPDILMLRIPASASDALFDMQSPAIPALVADTLVYYKAELSSAPPPPTRPGVRVELTPDYEPDEIMSLVRRIFPGYGNHYASNPLIDKAHILEGYADWAANFQGRANDEKHLFLVSYDNRTVGFIDTYWNRSTKTVDVGLTGILPEYAGKGIFSVLLPSALAHFKNQGAEAFMISTQIQNYIAQKAWHRAGFQFQNAYTTLHFNPLLRHSHTAVVEADSQPKAERSILELAADTVPSHELIAQNRLKLGGPNSDAGSFRVSLVHLSPTLSLGIVQHRHNEQLLGLSYYRFQASVAS